MSSRPLQHFTEVALELQRPHSFGDLLELVVNRCAKILDTDHASIRLLDPSGTRLLAVCRSGSPLHVNPKVEFKVGEGLVGWIVANAEPIRTGDADADPRFAQRPGLKERVGSFVGVPLIAGDNMLGVLSARHPDPERFDAAAQERLTLLGGIAAPHIEIARRDFVVRDPLTGLSNHAHFQENLEREIERSVTYGLPFCLVIVDLDNFEAVNDSRGHQVGDALLRTIARILAGRGQPSEEEPRPFRLRGQDFVSRFGGDEFALILPYTPKEGAVAKMEKLCAFIEGYDFAALDLPTQTVSVGIATVPDDAHDRASVIAAAKTAVGAAKRRGRNRAVAYSRALSTVSEIESSMSVDIDKFLALEKTIEQKAIRFVYQPIVDAKSGQIFAYEALCRPTHDSFAGPAALIETAEHAGRMLELGRVFRNIAMMPFGQMPGERLMFVNLHPRELLSALVHEQPMAKWASRVVLEITETAAIADYGRTRETLDKLRAHGYRIALDDLGAGYAGLNSLALLQPDFVKLDMALIRGIHEKSSSRRLVKHLLEFCAGESIPVIAEGVETDQEHAIVRDIGCPLIQGNYLAEPGPAFPDVATSAD
jgi:diguanylate cyclase (GGDEF)-like protein